MQLPDANLEKIAIGNLRKVNARYMREEQVTFKVYQQSVINMYRSDFPIIKTERARYFSLGMIKEIGEITEMFGGHRIEHTNLDINKAEEKLGDTLWYLAAISENYGLDLDAIARKNIQKTKSRYDENGVAQISTGER